MNKVYAAPQLNTGIFINLHKQVGVQRRAVKASPKVVMMVDHSSPTGVLVGVPFSSR